MQTINLDLSKKGVIPLLYAKQGDVGRKFRAIITDEGNAYPLPGGAAVSVWYSGSSGAGNYTDVGAGSAVSVSGNEIVVEMITQMLAAPGVGAVCIVISTANGDQLGTWNIPYIVEQLPGMGSEAAKEYFTAFSKAVKDLAYPDASLSAAGKAADAAAVGKALDGKADTARSASGSLITVDDSGDAPLHGLTLYGKTTQNGTPSPDNPVPLESVGDSGSVSVNVAGKNLLNPAEFEQGAIQALTVVVNEDGTVDISGRSNQTGNQDIGLMLGNAQLPVGTYTLSGCPSGGSSNAYKLYARIQKANGTINYVNDIGNGYSFTIGNGDIVDRITVRFGASYAITGTLHFKPQLEIGSAATEYEPYKGGALTASTPNGLPGIPVSSGGNYTDADGQQWICDYKDYKRGVYVKRTGLLFLDGNTQKFSYSTPVDLGECLRIIANPHLGNYGYRPPCMSDKLPYDTNYVADFEHFYLGTDSSIFLYVKKSRLATADAAGVRAYLAENPCTILYPLTEPVEKPLSAEEMAQYAALHTNKPYTTVYNDSGADMEVDYYAPNSAVPINLGSGKAGNLLTVDEHGCVTTAPKSSMPYAPAGYGLGSAKLISVDEIDTTVAPGFYCISGAMTVNNVTANYWYMIVGAYGSGTKHCVQKLYPVTSYRIELVRFLQSGVVGEWECDTPPMIPGVEYRTTERYNGKPVYVKLVDFGELPNSSAKYVNINSSGTIADAIDCKAIIKNTLTGDVYTTDIAEIDDCYAVSYGQVVIRTNASITNGATASARVKYTLV